MSSLHRKSLIATAAIFCCRFTGLLREMTFTTLFGASGALDAFYTAFRIPNMLRDMFAEGALSQSFTSVMSKVEQTDGREAAWTLVHRVSSQLISLMVCIVAAGVLLAGLCMQALYPENVGVRVDLRDPHAPEAAQVCVEAVYSGISTDADGLRVAHFVAESPLLGLTRESRLNQTALETMREGREVTLTTRPEKKTAGTILVAPRSYLDLAVDLCRIMWPFILLASLSALSMGVLNVFGIFGLPNLASAAFNLTTIAVGIAVGWLIDPSFGPRALYGFAAGVVCGGFAQILIQLPRLRKKGYRCRWDLGIVRQHLHLVFVEPRVRSVWLLMIPGAIAAGITQLTIFINTSFALHLPEGAVTSLNCAFHLWQLPVALFGVAVGMVVLPTISRMSITSANTDIPVRLAEAMRFVAFFAVPSMVLLGVWGEQIVSLLYQHGRFTPHASVVCGQVLAAYSIGLLGYAGMKVLQPVFMALEKPWAPAGIALCAAVISVSLNYIFVFVLSLDVSWLALTTSCITTLNFLFLFFYLRHLLGNMACRVLIPGLLRIAAAGSVLALFCWMVDRFFIRDLVHSVLVNRLGTMLIAGIAAGIVYLLASLLFRVPELTSFLSHLTRRKA